MIHIIGGDGIRPSPERVRAVVEMPNPTDVGSTRRFLGVVNHLAKFVPHLTTVVRPIQQLVSQDVVWSWGPEEEAAAQQVKNLISTAPVLAHFDPGKPLIAQCAASKSGLGAALMQEGHPIANASRAMTPAELNYAQIEKELFRVVLSLEKFRQYTYGRSVIAQNDHKPLVVIQKKAIAKAPVRLQKMLVRPDGL